jgi:hypothetical protein
MTELLVALGLIAGVLAAHEIGFWLGSLTRSADEAFERQVALVRTSTAALVAFLIGFAFSGAASRFIDRLDIIVKEANALGTVVVHPNGCGQARRAWKRGSYPRQGGAMPPLRKLGPPLRPPWFFTSYRCRSRASNRAFFALVFEVALRVTAPFRYA